MAEGWIRLHRKLQDNPLWSAETFTRGQAWVDLLLLANHKYGFFFLRGNRIEVQRGQVGWSVVKLADRWKWSRSKVNNFLKQLEKEQQITIEKNTIYSIITIINYEEYQKKEQQTVQQKSSRRAAEEQQKDINNNDNNKENEKEYSQIVKDLVDVYYNALDDVQKVRFQKHIDSYWDTCDKLMRIDGYTEDEIRTAIINGRRDPFWCTNFLSFNKLRDKSKKMGIKYIDKFLTLDGGNCKRPMLSFDQQGRLRIEEEKLQGMLNSPNSYRTEHINNQRKIVEDIRNGISK